MSDGFNKVADENAQIILSDEQMKSVEAALAGENVRIRAVPGAGKTTVCLRVASELEAKGLKVLQLTYSAVLKEEWRTSRRNSIVGPLNNPHTFHSFVVMLQKALNLPEKCKEDGDIRTFIESDPDPGECLKPEYVADAIMFDEAQDMYPLLFSLICWYAKACGNARFQLFIVGQEEQCVYENGKGGRALEDEKACLKYLTDNNAFSCILRSPHWTECPFTKSFRLTPATANAVNKLFKTNIEACNTRCSNMKPKVFCVNLFHVGSVAKRISKFIEKYGAQNVQLVAPSWKNNGANTKPVNQIKNVLSRMGYMFTDGQSKYRNNKTICYTCPGVKGTEALCTIIIGADSFSDNFVSLPQKFVSMTRAREQLVVFHSYKEVPWLVETPNAYESLGFDVEIDTPFAPEERQCGPRVITVYDLLRSATEIKKLMNEHACCNILKNASLELQIQKSLKFESHEEEFSKIFGIVITFIYAVSCNQTPGFGRIFDNILASSGKNGHVTLNRVYESLLKDNIEFPEYSEFMAMLENDIRTTSQQEIANAFKNHLRKHNLNEYAERIITLDNYEMLFPKKQREQLIGLINKKSKDWDYAEAAHASIAANTFNHDHQLISQIPNYEWIKQADLEHVIRECIQRFEDYHSSRPVTRFEKSVSFMCKEYINYDTVPYRICGIEGRVDAIIILNRKEYEIVEYKFKCSLEDSDFVQLFIYLCIMANNLPRGVRLYGVLFNLKTNEKHIMHLNPQTTTQKLLEAILDIHYKSSVSVNSIIHDTIHSKKRSKN